VHDYAGDFEQKLNIAEICCTVRQDLTGRRAQAASSGRVGFYGKSDYCYLAASSFDFTEQ
jgi:hypothetical protein